MKLRNNKKKIIIILSSLLIVSLALGTFKGYQSFCYDQWKTEMDMDSMMKLFNMQLQIPNGKISGIWTNKQRNQVLENGSFDIGIFAHYMLKKVTFQQIEYKDLEPQWFLLSAEKDTSTPDYLSTAECLKNFNENLLYNPEYEQYRRDVEFSSPLTMEDLLKNSQKVVELKNCLLDITKGKGYSLDELTDCPCPSQYLPK